MHQYKPFKDAHEAYGAFTEDEQNLEKAWAREKFQRDWLSRMAGARREGKEEGLAEGLEMGMEKGLQKGERKKALETARKMKAEGLDVSLISRITGLPEKEILKL